MVKNTIICLGMVALCSATVQAQDAELSYGNKASDHAPIGVMGDHMHKQGDWMFSYRFMHMNMNDNRQGRNNVEPATVATTVPNRFSSTAGQPPTLRVVPLEMTMNMHMLGGMYAPTDWLTLMVMGQYLEKDMEHVTFAGGMGSAPLGRFDTASSGWGDTKISSLIRLYEDDTHHVHLNAGLSLPTGSIDETDDVLTPMNMRPTLRMPYAMQLGSGTFDALPGITYTGRQNVWGWGAQYTAQIPLESENDEGYRWGDKHSVSAWGSYDWQQWLSTSARLTGTTQDSIHGIDPNIVAPVQTANPDNYGGEQVDLSVGINLLNPGGKLQGLRMGIEGSVPVYRNLNGTQLETDYTVTVGLQMAF